MKRFRSVRSRLGSAMQRKTKAGRSGDDVFVDAACFLGSSGDARALLTRFMQPRPTWYSSTERAFNRLFASLRVIVPFGAVVASALPLLPCFAAVVFLERAIIGRWSFLGRRRNGRVAPNFRVVFAGARVSSGGLGAEPPSVRARSACGTSRSLPSAVDRSRPAKSPASSCRAAAGANAVSAA